MSGASVSVSTWKFVAHSPAFQSPLSIPGARTFRFQNCWKRFLFGCCKKPSGPHPFGIAESVTACNRLNGQVQGRLVPSLRRSPRITLLGRSDESRNLSRFFTRAIDEDNEGTELEEGHIEIDSPSRGARLVGTIRRIRTTVQIFIASFVWLAFFFGASVWDGKGRKK